MSENELINKMEYDYAINLKNRIDEYNKFRMENRVLLEIPDITEEDLIQENIDDLNLAKHLTWNPIFRWKIRGVIKELKKRLEVSIDE